MRELAADGETAILNLGSSGRRDGNPPAGLQGESDFSEPERDWRVSTCGRTLGG